MKLLHNGRTANGSQGGLVIVFASLPLIYWWDKRFVPYGIMLLAVLLRWIWSSQASAI